MRWCDRKKLNDAYRAMLRKATPLMLQVSRQRLYTLRENVSHGDYPKAETMREQLILAGWHKVSDEMRE